jgi:transcriptional regulator with XRE-family HTH domain
MPRPLHPVKTAIVARGETYREFASRVGVSERVLAGVLNGRIASWPSLRRRCADELRRPEDELFPEEHMGSLR